LGLFKWRYKRVIRKRFMLGLILMVAAYNLIRLFNSLDLSIGTIELLSTPSWSQDSWSSAFSARGGNDDEYYTPRYFKTRGKQNRRATGRTAQGSSRSEPTSGSSVARPHGHQITAGILSVDTSLPITQHPITLLTQSARTAWDTKVAQQSKTLKSAVEEYKRRNKGRPPPKGFDKWWKLVKTHNVALPDEYDQINSDLELFRALSPTELNRRITDAMDYADTFHLIIEEGTIVADGTFSGNLIEGARERMSGQVELLDEFGIVQWLPNLRAVFGIHDTPLGFIGADHRGDLLSAVEDDECES
jgi:hypothetical protein